MEDYHQITLNEWVEMKDQLRRELNNVRTGFVRVGYVLRRMEETGAWYQAIDHIQMDGD